MECKAITEQSELKQALAVRMEVFVQEQGVSPEEEVDEYDASPSACRHFFSDGRRQSRRRGSLEDL
ncbi:GNAT family N-acetyltransferase [Cohnella rhizosphaerae]|uniref:hypothetical protein n=1 Tax=Cohnella rhizosphaerae TaxID=1457232 RepID=UPI0030B8DB02